jgi:AraC-like DNA-binding protein
MGRIFTRDSRVTSRSNASGAIKARQSACGRGERRLERTDAPVDEISWKVGYEDPAFFRRLFKRITGVTAGAYRRKFHIPEVEIV